MPLYFYAHTTARLTKQALGELMQQLMAALGVNSNRKMAWLVAPVGDAAVATASTGPCGLQTYSMLRSEAMRRESSCQFLAAFST
jgi:hypothetical protein